MNLFPGLWRPLSFWRLRVSSTESVVGRQPGHQPDQKDRMVVTPLATSEFVVVLPGLGASPSTTGNQGVLSAVSGTNQFPLFPGPHAVPIFVRWILQECQTAGKKNAGRRIEVGCLAEGLTSRGKVSLPIGL